MDNSKAFYANLNFVKMKMRVGTADANGNVIPSSTEETDVFINMNSVKYLYPTISTYDGTCGFNIIFLDDDEIFVTNASTDKFEVN